LKPLNQTAYFTEEKVDWLIDVYMNQLKSPSELILKTIERSRDGFQREFSKFQAYFQSIKFYTEEGLKERKEKLKLKILMSQLYGPGDIQEASKTKDGGSQ
jgi:RNAse (barnase) inhibitor barstar